MYRTLVLTVFAAGALAAGAARPAAPARAHHRAVHRHLAVAGGPSNSRRLNGFADDGFAASAAPGGGAVYQPAAFSEGRPRLVMERPLGFGAMGSVGLERAGGAGTPRDINGVTLSVPPPPSSLVGAGVSYRF